MLATNSMASTCSAPNDPACFNFVLLNAAYEGDSQIFAGLDQPVASEEERIARVNSAGRKIFDAHKVGQAHASEKRTFLVFFWDVTSPPVASYHMEVKDRNGVAVLDSVDSVIEEIPSEKILHPEKLRADKVTTEEAAKLVADGAIILPIFEEGDDPGMPSAVYRVTVSGFDQSLQVPWNDIGSNALALMCQEDYDGIYPPGGTKGENNKKGHYIAPTSINFLRTADKGKPVPGMIFPFISKP